MINKKMVTGTFATTMVLALMVTGCSKPSETPSPSTTPAASTAATEAPKAKEPITLTIWNNVASVDAEATDAVAQEIKKKFNITLKFLNGDPAKRQLQITSGEIPDLVFVDATARKQLLDSKMLKPLDDLISTNGKDIAANLAKPLAYSKKFMSNDGKLYVLPTHTAPSLEALASAPAPFEHIYGGLTRWDYYKELGFPVIKNSDDFLAMLSNMVKKHPTTADGKKVYGISVAGDFGLWEYNLPPQIGGGKWAVGAGMIADNNGVLVDQYANENAPFFSTSAKFYNKAYQMGLLDPESFTQKSDAIKTKVMNGQILSWTQGWFNSEINSALQKANPEASMVLIPGAFPTTLKGYGSSVGYVGTGYAISAASKYPDRAMELMNYFATYEGSRLTVSGVKGQHWDLINGKPEMKPEVVKAMKDDPDFVKKNGFGLNTAYGSLMLIDSTLVDPKDGSPINLSNTTSAMAALMNPAQKEYSEHFKGSYPGEAFEKAAGKAAIYYANGVAQGSIPAAPDDITRIVAAVNDSLTKNLPKIVMSKTDAEYSANVNAEIADLKKLGIEKANTWYTTEYEKAKTAVADFSK